MEIHEEQNVEIKKSTTKKIGGYWHRIVPIADKSGKILSYALKPLMVQFTIRDVIQVMVGAALLAIPVSFTEEAWVLGEELPLRNVIYIGLLSLFLVSVFVYYNFYRDNFAGHVLSFVKRVIGTYLIAMSVVALILTIIQKCPWEADAVLAIKRVIIVSFPATMSGTLSDTIK